MKSLILFSIFILTFSIGYAEEQIKSFTTNISGRTILTRYRIVDGKYELIESKEVTKQNIKNSVPTDQD